MKKGENRMKKMIPLLIGLLLLGAAAYYFLSKKGTGGGSPTIPSEGGGSGGSKLLDLNDTNSIIDNLSMTSSLKTKTKSWVKHINSQVASSSGGWSKTKLQDSANDRGITYSQQLVLSALWQMYQTAKVIDSAQFKIYEAELEELGQ